MTELQSSRAQLDAALAGAVADHERLAEIGAQLAECDEELAAAEHVWLELSEELDTR